MPLEIFAATANRSEMGLLVLPILLFFFWLEKRSPTKAKKAAIIFTATIWIFLIGLLPLHWRNRVLG